MNHASVFTGIGGFDLAAEWKGWNNVFMCEIDQAARDVLHKRFPDVTIHNDIYTLDGRPYRGKIDILTGGFPCQPFSLAGKRQGRDDDRYLWPEMLRIIGEIRPTYVIGENVLGITSMEDGATFDDIWTSLEAEGYTVEPFVLPASAVQAWHRRYRVWIIAYATDAGDQGMQRRQRTPHHTSGAQRDDTHPTRGHEPRQCSERQTEGQYRRLGSEQYAAHAHQPRLQGDGKCREDQRWQSTEGYARSSRRTRTDWAAEPRVGRVAHGVPHRVDRLKQLGNAIVPPQAYELFQIIEEHKNENT